MTETLNTNSELGDDGRFKYAPKRVFFKGQELPSNHVITHSGNGLVEGAQIGYIRGNLGILYWVHQSVIVRHE